MSDDEYGLVDLFFNQLVSANFIWVCNFNDYYPMGMFDNYIILKNSNQFGYAGFLTGKKLLFKNTYYNTIINRRIIEYLIIRFDL